MRLWRIVLLYFLFLGFILFGISNLKVFAASIWTQSDWTGGQGQASWTDSTKYSTGSAVLALASSQLKIASNSAWFDTSWKYRQKVTITASGSTVTDYQVPITLNTSGLVPSKMESDCRDLRVTDATGSAVPFWIVTSPDANICNRASTKIWIKASSIATTGSDFYIYYGNPSATSQSNGTNVFTVFADFTTGASLPSGWSQTYVHMRNTSVDGSTSSFSDSSYGSATVGSGVISISNTNGADVWRGDYGATQVYADATVSGSLVAETIVNSQTNSNEWAKSGISIQNVMNSGTSNGHAMIITTPRYGMAFQYQTLTGEWCSGGVCPSSVIAPNFNTNSGNNTSNTAYPIYLRLIKDGSNQISGYYSSNGTNWTQQGSTIAPWGVSANQSISLLVTAHSTTGTSVATFPYFYARKYLASVPSVGSFASEEKVYVSSGSLTSSIYDTGQSSNFGVLSYTVTTPTNTTASAKVRTSDSSTMSGALDFSACNSVTSDSDISSNNCVTDGKRYIQYQVNLSTSDNLSSPTFQSISIGYDPILPTPTPTPTPTNTPTPTPTPTPTASPSNSSSTVSNNSTPAGCSAQAPSGTPNLYQLDSSINSVTLYFTPVLGSNNYYIRYGTDSNVNQFATSFSNSDASGAVAHVIEGLQPGVTYYFSVRGGNGCATGNWSNISSTSTKGEYISQNPISNVIKTVEKAIVPKKEIKITNSSLTTKKSNVCSYVVQSGDSLWGIAQDKLADGSKFKDLNDLNKLASSVLSTGQELKLPCDKTPKTIAKAKQEVKQTGVKLDVTVLDTNRKPVEGAIVTLHSKVQMSKTDKNGIAHFENVEKGEHKVLLAYNEYSGEQNIKVDGAKKEQSLTVQVQMSNGFASPVVMFVVGIMGVVILVLGFIIFVLLKKPIFLVKAINP